MAALYFRISVQSEFLSLFFSFPYCAEFHLNWAQKLKALVVVKPALSCVLPLWYVHSFPYCAQFHLNWAQKLKVLVVPISRSLRAT
jgi:hypothetical protein